MIGQAAARLKRAVSAMPGPRDLVELLIAGAALGALGLMLSPASDLLHWSPRGGTEIFVIAALAFFVPALGEEIVFRSLLIPDRTEAPRALVWIVASILLFVAWHAVETLWLAGARVIFLRIDFLTLAAMLGLACAILRRRSGSIWTAVLLHWAAAVTWIGFLGGPGLGELG